LTLPLRRRATETAELRRIVTEQGQQIADLRREVEQLREHVTPSPLHPAVAQVTAWRGRTYASACTRQA
jgi:hypothetical protein